MVSVMRNVIVIGRQVVRSPLVPGIIIVILSLGVAASTAVFSVVDAVLLKQLPYGNAQHLVAIGTKAAEGLTAPWSYPDYELLGRSMQGVHDLVAYDPFEPGVLRDENGTASVEVVRSTTNIFRALGVRAALGSTYPVGAEGTTQTNDNLAVLSNELWRTTFGGRKDVLGKELSVDNKAYIIIGVLPDNIRFPIGMHRAIYVPIPLADAKRTRRNAHYFEVFGVLPPNETVTSAKEEVAAALGRLPGYEDTPLRDRETYLVPLDVLFRTSRAATLTSALCAALLLLGLACVNSCGLLLVEGIRRERDAALKIAIGAPRSHILGGMLLESALYALCIGVLGTITAIWFVRLVQKFVEDVFARGTDVRVDLRVLTFSILIAIIAATVAMIVPALKLSRTNPIEAIKAGKRGERGAVTATHLQGGLITLQVALSLVLLMMSATTLREFVTLLGVPTCPDPGHILTVDLEASATGESSTQLVNKIYRPLVEQVRELPGVLAAGVIDMLPIREWGRNSEAQVVGYAPDAAGHFPMAEVRLVSPGYFDVFGLTPVRGRLLSEGTDGARNSGSSVVVNEAFVRHILKNGQDPLTTQLEDGTGIDSRLAIVGVIPNRKQSIFEAARPEIDRIVGKEGVPDPLQLTRKMTLVVRTSIAPTVLSEPIRKILKRQYPTVAMKEPRLMSAIIADSLIYEQAKATIFTALSLSAWMITLAGIYAGIHYLISSRTHELSVKLALGATRGAIAGSLLLQSIGYVAAGIAAGWLLVGVFGKITKALVDAQTSIYSPQQVVAVTGLCLGAGAMAALLPGIRIWMIQPARLLAEE
jgi:predicted permease